MTKIVEETAETPAGMGIRNALLLLGAIVVLVAVYVTACILLGIGEVYAGYFFLFYWGSVAQAGFPALRHVIPGAVAGLLLALLLKVLTASALGVVTGGLIFVGVLLPVILCQLMGKFYTVINPATMLFLTFAAIVHVQMHGSFPGMFASLAVSVAVFVPAVWLGLRIVARRAAMA